jgi:hypothetical protein
VIGKHNIFKKIVKDKKFYGKRGGGGYIENRLKL